MTSVAEFGIFVDLGHGLEVVEADAQEARVQCELLPIVSAGNEPVPHRQLVIRDPAAGALKRVVATQEAAALRLVVDFLHA